MIYILEKKSNSLIKMAHSNSMIIFASILFILLSGDGLLRPLDNTIFVHAYYCDNDYCNSEQVSSVCLILLRI